MADGPILGVGFTGMDAFNGLLAHVRVMMAGPFSRESGRQIRDAYIAHVSEAFATRGASVGGWAPLSPAYARRKSRMYPAKPLLVAEGTMQLATTRPNDSRFIYDRRPSKVTLGSRSSTAAFHQSGAGNLPQRELFQNDSAWGEELAHIVSDVWFGQSIERVLRVVTFTGSQG